MSSKSPQYKVIVWGQKGQKAGTRIVSKKPYDQLGSARKYAQKQSSVKSRAWTAHYVELFDGKQCIERFKNGEIDPMLAVDAAIKQRVMDEVDVGGKKRTADDAAKYESEVRKHAAGAIKWLPKASQYGLSKDDAKAIRDKVRSETQTKPKPVKPKPKPKVRKPKQVIVDVELTQRRARSAETLQTLQIDAATAQAAMQALLRERQAAVKAAQSELENTLAQCAQMGVHAAIA